MAEKSTDADLKASVPAINAGLPIEPPFNFDEYWLRRGKEFADQTLLGLNRRLQSFILFLNILAGASFFGEIGYATFLKSADWIVFGCFIIPLLVSLAARYEIGIELVRPTFKSPDLRSPIQINRAFNEVVDSKREQLRRAQPWLLSALGTFVICIPMGLFYDNLKTVEEQIWEKNKEEVKLNLFEKGFEVSGMINGSSLDFVISGTNNRKENIEGKKIAKTKDTLIQFSRQVQKDELFEFDYEFETFGFVTRSIAVKYKDGLVNRTIEKVIMPKVDGESAKE